MGVACVSAQVWLFEDTYPDYYRSIYSFLK
jgi:hypothetical protein